jgi:hypothetical protein
VPTHPPPPTAPTNAPCRPRCELFEEDDRLPSESCDCSSALSTASSSSSSSARPTGSLLIRTRGHRTPTRCGMLATGCTCNTRRRGLPRPSRVPRLGACLHCLQCPQQRESGRQPDTHLETRAHDYQEISCSRVPLDERVITVRQLQTRRLARARVPAASTPTVTTQTPRPSHLLPKKCDVRFDNTGAASFAPRYNDVGRVECIIFRPTPRTPTLAKELFFEPISVIALAA